jgi:hypothetical protein
LGPSVRDAVANCLRPGPLGHRRKRAASRRSPINPLAGIAAQDQSTGCLYFACSVYVLTVTALRPPGEVNFRQLIPLRPS